MKGNRDYRMDLCQGYAASRARGHLSGQPRAKTVPALILEGMDGLAGGLCVDQGGEGLLECRGMALARGAHELCIIRARRADAAPRTDGKRQPRHRRLARLTHG